MANKIILLGERHSEEYKTREKLNKLFREDYTMKIFHENTDNVTYNINGQDIKSIPIKDAAPSYVEYLFQMINLLLHSILNDKPLDNIYKMSPSTRLHNYSKFGVVHDILTKQYTIKEIINNPEEIYNDAKKNIINLCKQIGSKLAILISNEIAEQSFEPTNLEFQRRITQLYNDSSTLVDMAILKVFFEEYKKQTTNNTDYVIVVGQNHIKKLAELFKYYKIPVVSYLHEDQIQTAGRKRRSSKYTKKRRRHRRRQPTRRKSKRVLRSRRY